MSDTLSLSSSASLDNRFDGQIASLKAMSLDGQKKTSEKMSEKKMRETASQFEEMITRLLLKEMRKTIPKDGFIEESHATEMYTDMMDDHLAKQLSENSSMGIGDMVYNELKAKNDRIANPDATKSSQDFKSLSPNSGFPTEPKFMPLVNDSETFMQFQEKNRMRDLPKAKDPYMPLNGRHSISTDRIENR